MTTRAAQELKAAIVDVPDFPKPGILFRDIAPLLKSHFAATIEALDGLLTEAEWRGIDAVAGIESRGFILGAALALKRGKGFVLVRKQGKLPPPVVDVAYDLEYGSGVLEMQRGQGRVLLIDDVLATGGTMRASAELCVARGLRGGRARGADRSEDRRRLSMARHAAARRHQLLTSGISMSELPRMLVVMALAAESAGVFEEARVPVLYCGVGKVNAAIALTRELRRYAHASQPAPLVLNFGSAGSRVHATGSLVACHEFVQRDMDVSGLGFALGVTPYDDTPARLSLRAAASRTCRRRSAGAAIRSRWTPARSSAMWWTWRLTRSPRCAGWRARRSPAPNTSPTAPIMRPRIIGATTCTRPRRSFSSCTVPRSSRGAGGRGKESSDAAVTTAQKPR